MTIVHHMPVAGPLAAAVLIEEVQLERYRVFRVCAQWHGRGDPPADGQPDTRGSYQDNYDASTHELARAVAHYAVAELRASFPPDLRKIATDVKRRRPGLATLTTPAIGGGLVLGDTPSDEVPDGR